MDLDKNALLIGDGALLVECAKGALARGLRIVAVATSSPIARDWAAGHGIPVAAHPAELPALLAGEHVDFLFSVVSLWMLPPEVLALPQRCAVNFHDGPLPADAGVHAPVWALWRGAGRHGVTWHLMTAGADRGDIVARREFGLGPDETSLDLNLRCFDAGLELFGPMLDGLIAGTSRAVPQDFTGRTYHGRWERPVLVYDRSWSAKQLVRAVRATRFGAHPNTFGLVQMQFAGRIRPVRDAAITGIWSTRPAGSVVELDDDGLTLATTTMDVRLTMTTVGLALDDRADEVSSERAATLMTGYVRALRGESAWVSRLADLHPAALPARDEAGGFSPAPRWMVPGDREALLAAVLAFCARVTGQTALDVGLRGYVQAGEVLAATVPIRVPELAGSFATFSARVRGGLRELEERGGFLPDIFDRYPQLIQRELPIVVDLTPGAASTATKSGPAVRITAEGCWWPQRWLADSFDAFAADLAAGVSPDAADLLSPHDRRLLDDLNATDTDVPLHRRADELFADRAASRPAAVAVRSAGEIMTYADLDHRVNQLAGCLAGCGVGPGSVVGVLLPRGSDLVAALLAVMRSGATYVPLDPLYPADRITDALADSGAALLVTHRALRVGDTPVLCLDEPLPPGHPPTGRAGDLAYVIYTSGSTGRPKGVRVTHRGLTNLLCAMARVPGFTSADTLLAVTTVCFDIAALELFLPLITGGCLEIAPAQVAADGPALRDLIEQARPTVLQATPATWRMLVAADCRADDLRAWSGGEALPGDLAVELLGRHGELWNLYGPTETTIWSTVDQVTAEVPVAIGRPIANTSCHILDEQLRPVPVGVPGELCLGGAGVADGYHRRPELTADRFRDTPYGRLYRTGDRVRLDHDGRLRYLERLDQQIKLHGYRIEPGEIEAALRAHPGVRDAAVVLRGQRLLGYLQPTGERPAEADIRRALKARLPEYMLPSALIWLDALPLTLNGKIDRKALPEPSCSSEPTVDGVLATILRHATDLLGQPIRPDTRLADAGLDSLAALELGRRISASLGLDLAPTVALAHPTPADLAAHIEGTDTGPIDLTAEVQLPTDITPAGPRAVFLTGATGFVGAFLLHALLERTDAVVHCLVRATDEHAGHKRLRAVWERYRLAHPAFDDRIRIVTGDLRRPLLGLTEPAFDELAATVDAIYHAGAQVNAVHTYPALRAANVDGTTHILRMATRHHPKPVHHVSTNEVFAHDPTNPAPRNPTDPTGPPALLHGGYAQTKWAAEALVRLAHDRGLPTLVYRLPRILGDREHGACQSDDLLWRVIKGSIQARTAPAVDAGFDAVPVDHAVAAIVDLSLTTVPDGRAFHLTNPQRLSFTAIINHLRDLGYQLTELPLTDWTATIHADPTNAAAAVCDVFAHHIAGDWSTLTLTPSGPPSPPITPEHLTRHIHYFTDTGYLPAPPVTAGPGSLNSVDEPSFPCATGNGTVMSVPNPAH
ncbi:amino acid adenylation domain-containing protein [Longispora sp. NPDC051575]|uniref:amino acid adenylation domain-containing protein n=1 Tax=Longispora sp. NPDC051575 TaxID=3154943 RepID=UPI00343FD106